MSKRILPILGLLLIAALSSNAQTMSQWVKAADTAYAKQDYYSAFKYYEVALEYDSTRTDLWYQYAESARKFNAYLYAEKGYLKSKALKPEATLYLAEVKRKIGKYDEAKSLYQSFLTSNPNCSAEHLTLAQTGIKACDTAFELINEKKPLSIRHLGVEVNTPYSDFGPALLGDELFYTSFNYTEPKDKNRPPRIFNRLYSSKNNAAGAMLSESINERGKHVAHTAFSPDNKRIYYTVCEYINNTAAIRCDLYARDMVGNNSYGPPQKLTINDPVATNTHPSVGIDAATGNQVLFFASDRSGGKGKLDIWKSVQQTDGNWSSPQNLSFNTEGDDATPFFHSRTQQLYFASNRLLGLGGYDIFKATEDGGSWTVPVNMGTPVNTSFDDLYYTSDEEGETVYFASNRFGSAYIEPDKEACCFDLYTYENDLKIDLIVSTFNGKTKEQLKGTTVYLYDVTDGERVLVDSVTNWDGNEFKFPVKINRVYEIEGKKDGYSQALDRLDLRNMELNGSQTIKRDLFLTPNIVDLEVRTFDEVTKKELQGCTVSLFEIVGSDTILVIKDLKPDANTYLFPIELNKKYIVKAEKPGFSYSSATLLFTKEDAVRANNQFRIDLFLRRTSFKDFLPLIVYFDNDEPDKRTMKTTTAKTYDQTYDAYYPQKESFKVEYTKGIAANDVEFTEELVDNFFERDVAGGYKDLVSFSSALLDYLQQGHGLEMEIQGYASPRAATVYNQNLSKRRVDCVRNFFETYNNGQFLPYLKSGKLSIREASFGEEKPINLTVSDDISDRQKSVYSVLASLERRVEIIEINVILTEN